MNETPIPPLELNENENVNEEEQDESWILNYGDDSDDDVDGDEQPTVDISESSIVAPINSLNDNTETDPLALTDEGIPSTSATNHDQFSNVSLESNRDEEQLEITANQVTENITSQPENDANHNNTTNADEPINESTDQLAIFANHSTTTNADEPINESIDQRAFDLSDTANGNAVEQDPDESLNVKPDSLDLWEVERMDNDSDIDDILDERTGNVPNDVLRELIHDDDVTIFIGQNGIPKPLGFVTKDDLVKRENDQMSGNIAFDERVCIFESFVLH